MEEGVPQIFCLGMVTNIHLDLSFSSFLQPVICVLPPHICSEIVTYFLLAPIYLSPVSVS